MKLINPFKRNRKYFKNRQEDCQVKGCEGKMSFDLAATNKTVTDAIVYTCTVCGNRVISI